MFNFLVLNYGGRHNDCFFGLFFDLNGILKMKNPACSRAGFFLNFWT